jgi:hypothetical protein
MLINFDKTVELSYDALFKLGSIQNQDYQVIQSFWRKACRSFSIVSGYLPTGQDCKPDIHCNGRWWRETLPVLHCARSTFLVCPSGPREVDMIENLDPLGLLGISHQPQPIALFDPCLQLLVGLRPVNDFGTASVACIKEEILKEASIEVIGVIVVCIAR